MRYFLHIITFLWLAMLTIEMRTRDTPCEEIIIIPEQNDFLITANAKNMLRACEYYGVKNPSIVTAQAILESGNFRSRVFKEYNNPFGLYNNKKQEYYRFNHWTESIYAYIRMVEYKYDSGDYYEFLKELPYATDEDYIDKVKRIENNLKDDKRRS